MSCPAIVNQFSAKYLITMSFFCGERGFLFNDELIVSLFLLFFSVTLPWTSKGKWIGTLCFRKLGHFGDFEKKSMLRLLYTQHANKICQSP